MTAIVGSVRYTKEVEFQQPFSFQSTLVSVFQGALYNAPSLRKTLTQKGYTLTTGLDAELVCAAYHAFGKDCVQQLDGKFSFAVWDKQKSIVFCARDRFGEQPFYFLHDEQREFRFASSLSYVVDSINDVSINESMLYLYLVHGFTKAPHQPWKTFYKNVYQLPAAHTLTYHIEEDSWEISAYWDLDKETREDQPNAIERFSELLILSVSNRIPQNSTVGQIINQNVSSRSIAAILQSNQSSARFLDDHLIDESLADRFEAIILQHREPIRSMAVCNQYFLYEKAAANGITVLFDHLGAAESLAGHPSYTNWYLQELIATVGWKEACIEAESFKANQLLDQWNWRNRIAGYFPSIIALRQEKKMLAHQRKCIWMHPDFTAYAKDRLAIQKPIIEKLNDIQYYDLMVMGLEEKLREANTNAKAHGIDLRLPYLDPTLVQFVLSLPSTYRMQRGYDQWILREMMKRFGAEPQIDPKQSSYPSILSEKWIDDPLMKEMTNMAWERLNQANITRPSKKPLSTTERFRILVAGILLA